MKTISLENLTERLVFFAIEVQTPLLEGTPLYHQFHNDYLLSGSTAFPENATLFPDSLAAERLIKKLSKLYPDCTFTLIQITY